MGFSKGVVAGLVLSLSLISSHGVQALPVADNHANGITTQVPSTTIHRAPGTIGTLFTSLEMGGVVTSFPFATQTITETTPSLKSALPTYPTTLSSNATATAKEAGPLASEDAVDPFQPFATGPYPSQVTARGDHPIPRLNVIEQSSPYHTNKFYANFYLGSQGSGTFTHPYTVTWSKGSGNANSWGMAITQHDNSAKAFGPTNDEPDSPVDYFINPLGIQHVILSASELGASTVLSTSDLDTFSANAILTPDASSNSSTLVIPVVQGMGFVTGIYTNLTPNIQSGTFFSNLVSDNTVATGIYKYQVQLDDGSSWLLYAVPSDGSDPKLTLASSTSIAGPSGWSGFIQIAKNPAGSAGESLYDAAAGAYPSAGSISASVSGNSGSYTLSWTKSGLVTSQNLLMFALPHHLAAFDGVTSRSVQSGLSLSTTTKGNATAVSADSWTLTESNLPINIGFEPFNVKTGTATKQYSSAALSAIAAAASAEIAEDMGAQSNLNSMYYSGKALSKFASIVYVIHDVLGDNNLAAQGLAQLQTAFALFATNQQQFPLVYDTVWSGAVSSATYVTNDTGADFGNTCYNDHHFHYGYFLHAASIIAYLDPSWVSTNGDWVNMLARDANNPSSADSTFPVFRMFDWYHGHSWAAGLFEAGDSKNEESSSEDVMFAYGLKMWGHATGNAAMEAQGNLMLAVLARSLNSYFLYSDGNGIEPSNFVGNKVSGILFENKIDHTTYFGANLEFIQAIHMIPLEPSSAYIRPASFVQQEWEAFFADGAIDPASNVDGGWKGILYANLALYDPVSSWNFFNQPSFNSSWLDGGASLTWYLTLAAGLGGA